jgi:hypothetical protein
MPKPGYTCITLKTGKARLLKTEAEKHRARTQRTPAKLLWAVSGQAPSIKTALQKYWYSLR